MCSVLNVVCVGIEAYMVPEMGFEPTSREAADFESAMYTVPSLWHL